MDRKSVSTLPKATGGLPLSLVPRHPEIALRAYGIFLSRGATHGHDLDDWLQAEREIMAGLVSKRNVAVGQPSFRAKRKETA
jgi:hypothetical protein